MVKSTKGSNLKHFAFQDYVFCSCGCVMKVLARIVI